MYLLMSYKALKDAVNNLFNRQFSYIAEYKKLGNWHCSLSLG